MRALDEWGNDKTKIRVRLFRSREKPDRPGTRISVKINRNFTKFTEEEPQDSLGENRETLDPHASGEDLEAFLRRRQPLRRAFAA